MSTQRTVIFGNGIQLYNAHGNMLTMPHLNTMEWDYKGNLTKTIGGTVTTYYRYDSNGNRVRKIANKSGAVTEVRIYIGNYEIYRRKVRGTLDTERETSFVSDDQKRIAIIDTRNVPVPVEVTIRYQYDNHLGSACLELDGSAQVISYEEYHPFGTTSYRAGRNATETSLKRYKYVGKERDEETGLYYYGARYYAAWLCRFVSVDPLQFKYPELSTYQYASNRPILMIDIDGLEGTVRDINYMPEAEPYKEKAKLPKHTTELNYFEGYVGSGSLKNGIKYNLTSGIATDDAGVTHFTIVTEYTPNEKSNKLYSFGGSIGCDIGYRVDTRPTFRKTLEGDATSVSTTTPTLKFSLGFGIVLNKYGNGYTFGPSAGLLIDRTTSRLKESISLSKAEAEQTHTDDGIFLSVSAPVYDSKTKIWSSTVIVSDIHFNTKDTRIKVFSFDKKMWESKAYSQKAHIIEKESN